LAQKIKPPLFDTLENRAKKIKLIAMDVDGVLTAGDIVVLNSGEEVKLWNSKDRLCMALMRELKIPIVLAWITGRSSKTVSFAAKDLGIAHLVQGSHDKKKALETILKNRNLSFSEAAYIGDDLIDIPPLAHVGFSACPADAALDVLRKVHYVSPLGGGKGAVRDVLEFILKAQNQWEKLVSSFHS
jgi:3-deoxy-D-manno-octulosonate 8-phosphate phosphatase (KDO 8-P phosphatase)